MQRKPIDWNLCICLSCNTIKCVHPTHLVCVCIIRAQKKKNVDMPHNWVFFLHYILLYPQCGLAGSDVQCGLSCGPCVPSVVSMLWFSASLSAHSTTDRGCNVTPSRLPSTDKIKTYEAIAVYGMIYNTYIQPCHADIGCCELTVERTHGRINAEKVWRWNNDWYKKWK